MIKRPDNNTSLNPGDLTKENKSESFLSEQELQESEAYPHVQNMEPQICVAATATTTEYPRHVNVQLDLWKRAKNNFQALQSRSNHHSIDYKPIVNDLGQSLKDLFGLQHFSNGRRTPPLGKYVDKTLLKRKGMGSQQG